MKLMQMIMIFLFSLPVLSAHYFSLEQSPLTTLSALTSVVILFYCLCPLLTNLQRGPVRTIVGLATLSVLAIYFYGQLLSYYLQGSYFNQQFFFHFNISTLLETWSVYYPLLFLFLGWILCVWLTFLYFRNRAHSPDHSISVMVLMLVSALALDPGIRRSAIANINSLTSPELISLELIDWDQLGLDRNALTNYNDTVLSGKNLVLVFLEGLEKLYTDESVFPGLTPNLIALNAEGWQLGNLDQVTGSEWTMGGIVATLCGTPLVYESSLGANNIMFSRFLDRVLCLPDILNRAGYQQVFMGGASTEFAGKGDFLRKHSFDQVLGRDELTPELDDPAYLGAWGLFDDSLFTLALQQFERLASAPQPFNLTLLTIDTHHPSGEPSSSCSPYGEIDNSILHAVHCTDYLVGKFIERLKQHPAYENTIVVLVSDHLAMRNNAFSLFPFGYERRLYFNVLNSGNQISSQLTATPMDLAPTILNLLDLTVAGEISFLAGVDLLAHGVEAAEIDVHDPRRSDSIRYINSNYLSSAENQVLYTLQADAVDKIDFVNHIEDIEFARKGLEFTVTGNDPYFILPAIPISRQQELYLYITLEVEKRSTIVLYYMTDADDGYSETRKLTRITVPGTNQIVFGLDSSGGLGRLRIDPGANPGRYFISSLEVRS